MGRAECRQATLTHASGRTAAAAAPCPLSGPSRRQRRNDDPVASQTPTYPAALTANFKEDALVSERSTEYCNADHRDKLNGRLSDATTRTSFLNLAASCRRRDEALVDRSPGQRGHPWCSGP